MRIPNDFRLVLCVLFRGTDLRGCYLLHSMVVAKAVVTTTDRPKPAATNRKHIKKEIQTYVEKYNNKIINTYLYNGRFTGARHVLYNNN